MIKGRRTQIYPELKRERLNFGNNEPPVSVESLLGVREVNRERARCRQRSTLKFLAEYQSVQRVKFHIAQRTAVEKVPLPESSKLSNF